LVLGVSTPPHRGVEGCLSSREYILVVGGVELSESVMAFTITPLARDVEIL
jgi:hypothetical protein